MKTSSGFLFCALLLTCVCCALAACPGSWTPCQCLNGLINCRKHNKPDLVKFDVSGEDFHTLDYSFNLLSHLDDDAFAALSNPAFSTLLLQYNNISSISANAFDGVANTLRVLNLAHNKLKVLPDALTFFPTINDLDVSGNPIEGDKRDPHTHRTTSGFKESVMRAIGDTLTRFKFGDAFTLDQWPKSVSHLVSLTHLHVDGLRLNFLQSGALHGFEHTLLSLTIEHSRLIQIPLELARLTVLEELHIDHNHAPGGNGNDIIIESALKALNSTLKTLSFKYDGLTVFPEEISFLGRLKNLSLEGNSLEFISDEAIQFIQKTTIEILSFRNCDLTRIPGSMSDVANLIEIDFSHNKISSIENNDLFNLPHLTKISFAENPLQYISRNSFRGLNAVRYLDLSNSNVTVISEAIQNMAALETLDVTNARIDCTCDLYWIKRWLVIYGRTIEIFGACETIDQSVQSYIDDRIPHCREYLQP